MESRIAEAREPPEPRRHAAGSRWIAWACVLAFLALPAAWFWRVTTGAAVIVQGDAAAFYEPYFRVAAESLHAGRAPLWNRYMFGGMPLLAAQQSSPLYPPNVLLLLALPSWVALQVTLLLHLGAAGACAFLWLRALGVRTASAVLGGLVYGSGGFAMCHVAHVGTILALPWIPLVLLGYTRWVGEQRSRWLVLMALATGCLFLSGYPQIIVYGAGFAGTYVLFALPATKRLVAGGLAALALGVGLSALQGVPGLLALRGDALLRLSDGYESSMKLSFHPHYLLSWLFPLAWPGRMADVIGYVGVAPLVLALWGAIGPVPRARRARAFACAWVVLSLLLSFGVYFPPLARLVYALPVVGSLGMPANHLLECTLAATLLVALGFDAVLARERPTADTGFAAVVVAVLVGAATLLGSASSYAPSEPAVAMNASFAVLGRQVFFLLTSALVLVALLADKRGKERTSLSAALVVLVAADLLLFSAELHNDLTSPDKELYTRSPAAADYLHERAEGLFPERVISFDANGMMHPYAHSKELLATNFFMAWGVESLIGHDGLQPGGFPWEVDTVIPSWGETSPDTVASPGFRESLDLFGVRWLLVEHEKSAEVAARFPFVRAFGEIDLYENPTALPRLFACSDADRGPFSAAQSAPEISLWEPNGRHWIPDREHSRAGHIEPLSYAPGRVRAAVNAEHEMLIVHGTNGVRGWEAFVDGRSVPRIRVEHTFDGVVVRPGRHEVEFRYRPWAWSIGLGGTLASGALLCVLGVVLRRRAAQDAALPPWKRADVSSR